MELSTLMPVGETLQCNYSPVYGLITQGYRTQLYPSVLLTLLWILLYVFSCRRVFLFFFFWWVLVFFINGYSADSYDFGVPMREGGAQCLSIWPILCHYWLRGSSSYIGGAPHATPKSVETVPPLCFLILYSVFFPECLSFLCELPQTFFFFH